MYERIIMRVIHLSKLSRVVTRYAAPIIIVLTCVPTSSFSGPKQIAAGAKLKTKVDRRVLVRSLKRAIPQLMKDGDVPGLSIVLIRNGQVFWHQAFGVSNADTNVPLSDATVFETASLTKPVLAYGALKLVDSGKLDLDTPLVNYWPGMLVASSDQSKLITARMVLSHTTGLQNELQGGKELEIHFTPGERFSYSGEGFIYLQKIIEHITGERLDVYMKKAVFEPLGMTSASYLWRDDYQTLMANGHNAAGIVAERIKPTEVKLSWLHTTPLDYARFVVAVMHGVGLKSDTAKLMLTPQVHIDESCVFCLKPGVGRISSSLSWGLGWGLERSGAGEAFWHWGENRGEFQTFAMAYPREGTGVVIFTNSGNGFSIMPFVVSEAIGGAHPAFAWMGYDLYNSPKKTQFRANNLPIKILLKEILHRGPAAISDYRRLYKDGSGPNNLNEQQINTLGYWLIAKTKLKEAIEVFRLNVEYFPHSANAYDSLGEAYMIRGDKVEAIRNYQKSLELNPKNGNAVEMLKKLGEEPSPF